MHSLSFETAFGTCALSWGDAGITRFELAPARPSAPPTGAGEAPPWITQTAARVSLHLAGAPQDFSGERLDWSIVSAFQRAVYLATQAIAPGRKASYGEIARAVGMGPEGARSVGAALASNPWPLIVPCHRVVSSDGRMTGFSAPGGVRTKTRLLVLEGAELLSD